MYKGNVYQGKALVIEDELIIGRLFIEVLASEGFDVDFAPNGMVAIEKVNETDYQLCVSDIKMPGINGIDFYHYLEMEHPEMLARVILTTGDTRSPAIREFLKNGQKNFIPKPVLPSELVRKVKEVMRGNRGFPTAAA
ncbi:MAG: response regulator [Dehalococcoidia bacterium]|jgi:DNA-binding response OmpR family regulator